MATAEAIEHCMRIKIPEISKLVSIWSPEVWIHGVPWEISIRKIQTGEREGEPSLGIFLHCANKDKSSHWSLSGIAYFKLLPFSDHEYYYLNPVEYYCPPFVFDHSGHGFGENKFIRWNDLFDEAKHYVKNDTIELKIYVRAEDPNNPKRSVLNFDCIEKCCHNGRLGTYRLTVTNVENLMAVRSPKITLSGLHWNIQVSQERTAHLGVSLQLEESTEKLSCKMTMSIKLVSFINDAQAIEKCDTTQHKNKCSMEISAVEIVPWDELIKPENGFVNNDSITLEIKLNSGTPEGDGVSSMEIAKRTKLSSECAAKYLQMECAICFEHIERQDLASTPCGHLFCFECIKKAITNRAACPACGEVVQLCDLRRLYLPV